MDRLYSLQEVAEATGFGYGTIRRAVVDGEIEASKLRGQWRVSEEAFQRWVQRGRVGRVEAPVRASERKQARTAALSLRERVRTERKEAA